MNATTGRSVIVVGAGMARLVAALQAQQLGGQVTLLEKGNAPGGSLALSGGTLRCARAMQICAASCHVVIDLRGSRCISAGSQNGVRRIKWCVRILALLLARRVGAPGRLHHRASDGATDTGACRRANNCIGPALPSDSGVAPKGRAAA